MSIKIKGSIPEKTLLKFQDKMPIGTMGTGELVPIDTPNFDGNRTPKASALSKYLQRSDGFVWALFGAPLVAEYPNAFGIMERVVIDGGHRVSMLQRVYPNISEYPATIVQVESKEKAHQYFHRINGTSSSKVSAECRFVNEVLGKEINKLNDDIVHILGMTDVVIWDSEDNFVPKTNTPTWKITYKAMEEMVKLDKGNTLNALTTYTDAFRGLNNFSNNNVNVITAQIVKGLHTVFHVYSNHFSKLNMFHFCHWFNSNVALMPAKEEWQFNELKHDRLEQRHLGTAYGIMKRYATYCRNSSLKGGVTVPKLELIEDVYYAHDRKRQTKRLTSE